MSDDTKKILVIGVAEHKEIYTSLLRPISKNVSLESILEVFGSSPKRDKEYLRDFLLKNPKRYAAAIVVSKLRDYMKIVTNKELFSGKVIFHKAFDSSPKLSGADLYWTGSLYPREASLEVKELLDIK